MQPARAVSALAGSSGFNAVAIRRFSVFLVVSVAGRVRRHSATKLSDLA